jgi:hypothetical protein
MKKYITNCWTSIRNSCSKVSNSKLNWIKSIKKARNAKYIAKLENQSFPLFDKQFVKLGKMLPPTMMQEEWMNKWVQESMARREIESQSCRVILAKLENSIASKQSLGLATAVASDLSVETQEFKHDSKNAVAKRHRLSMSILVVCVAALSFVMGTVMTTPGDILSPSQPPQSIQDAYEISRDPNQLYDDLQNKGVLLFRNISLGTASDIVSINDWTNVYLSKLSNLKVNASLPGEPVVFLLEAFSVRFEQLLKFSDFTEYYYDVLNSISRFNVSGVPIFHSEFLNNYVYLAFSCNGFDYFIKISEVFSDGEAITPINSKTLEILIKNLFGLTNTQL